MWPQLWPRYSRWDIENPEVVAQIAANQPSFKTLDLCIVVKVFVPVLLIVNGLFKFCYASNAITVIWQHYVLKNNSNLFKFRAIAGFLEHLFVILVFALSGLGVLSS